MQSLTIVPVDPSNPVVARQLHSLQQQAYTLEAEQIGCSEFPPLRETVEELCQSTDRFIATVSVETFLGALSFCESESHITITRLVVSPHHLRQGIGTALLTELEKRLSPKDFFVTTGQKNAPAIKLYERNGFSVSSVSVSPEGIHLIHFRKAMG